MDASQRSSIQEFASSSNRNDKDRKAARKFLIRTSDYSPSGSYRELLRRKSVLDAVSYEIHEHVHGQYMNEDIDIDDITDRQMWLMEREGTKPLRETLEEKQGWFKRLFRRSK